MKKRVLPLTLSVFALGGMCAMVLFGCSDKEKQNKKTASSSQVSSSSASQASSSQPVSSSSSSSQTAASSDNASSAMPEEKANVTEIVNGNYTSIKGTWQDAQGNRLTFDENGLVSDTYEINGLSATDYGTAAGGVYGGETGGFLLEVIPSGVRIADTENFTDNSDTSRDRLWTGVGIQSFNEQGSFYYRVE